MATHRDYKIARVIETAGSVTVLVRVYEGEYRDIADPTGGDPVRTYVRARKVREKELEFDPAAYTPARLRGHLDDLLSREGALTSIPEHVRKRAPVLQARAERVIA